MITTCAKCGGLRAEPGEMFGGKPCECPLPPATCYVASWIDRCAEVSRYGLMLGALQGLRYRVDDATRKVIDEVLKEVEPPTPHNEKGQR